jgi:hypothetical protein
MVSCLLVETAMRTAVRARCGYQGHVCLTYAGRLHVQSDYGVRAQLLCFLDCPFYCLDFGLPYLGGEGSYLSAPKRLQTCLEYSANSSRARYHLQLWRRALFPPPILLAPALRVEGRSPLLGSLVRNLSSHFTSSLDF